MRRYLLWPLACALLAGLVLRRRFTAVTVTGDSMMPALAPGDRVLVRQVRLGQLRRGQVVVMEMPGLAGDRARPLHSPARHREWAIKRVAAVPGDPRPAYCQPETADPPERLVPPGKLVVIGDNAAWSQDSRQLGYFPGDRLLGVVLRRLAHR